MYKFIGFLLGCVVFYIGFNWFVSYQIESSFRSAVQSIDPAAALQDLTSESITTDTTNELTSTNEIEDTNIDVVESDLAQETEQESEIPAPPMLNNDTTSISQTYLVSVSFSEEVNAKGVLRLIKKVEQLKHINFSVHQDEKGSYAISMIIDTPENYELSYQQFLNQFEFLERPSGAVLL